MAIRKKQVTRDLSNSNLEKIKEEVVILLTGQDPFHDKEFDYVALLKRVIVILIAVYGIGKFGIARQLAFSIASVLFTQWLEMRALENALPAHRSLSYKKH